MTDRIIPLPDGRFSVSREDLKLASDALRETEHQSRFNYQRARAVACRELQLNIHAALNKDTTDDTA